jgi:hypothetical protein
MSYEMTRGMNGFGVGILASYSIPMIHRDAVCVGARLGRRRISVVVCL